MTTQKFDQLVVGETDEAAWADLDYLYPGIRNAPAGITVYDSKGRSAGLYVIRTKNVQPGAMYVGDDMMVINDNPQRTTAYGHYVEVHHTAGVDKDSISQGDEYDGYNERPVVMTDPYDTDKGGLTELGRRGTICQKGSSPHPFSTMQTILGPTGFLHAFVVGVGAILRSIFALPVGAVLAQWWTRVNGVSYPTSHIRCDQNNPDNALGMIFSDQGFVIQEVKTGLNVFVFDIHTQRGYIYGHEVLVKS